MHVLEVDQYPNSEVGNWPVTNFNIDKQDHSNAQDQKRDQVPSWTRRRWSLAEFKKKKLSDSVQYLIC